MDFDFFLPLLLFLGVLISALYLYDSIGLIGGWKGIFTFVLLIFGIRVDFLRREQKKNDQGHAEAIAWVEEEVSRVYRGRADRSGRTFARYCKLFEITAAIGEDKLVSFDTRLKKLNGRRPISNLRMPDLLEQIDIDMAYNSNAIEGNPINLKETTLILAGFIGGRRQQLRHVKDIEGHHKAFNRVRKMATGKSQISMDLLLEIHKLVLFDSEDGGIIRSGNEGAMINQTKVLLAMPDEIHDLLKRLVEMISNNTARLHPFLLAVTAHQVFVRIHPFRDGNGRTARLIANFILLQHGYPVIIVPFKERDRYMTAIRDWDGGNSSTLTSVMASLLDDSFDRYFTILKIS